VTPIAPANGAPVARLREEVRDIKRVVTFLGAVVVLALLLNVSYAVREVGLRFGGCIGWAFALGLVGLMVGFLFAIPRVLQHEARTSRAAAPGPTEAQVDEEVKPGYEQRVNTNLEEISDWLTKILVGIGLIQLKEVPGLVRSLAKTIAPSLGEVSAATVSAAAAMSVFYPVAGFLFGYLVTRLYVQGAFARADVEAYRQARSSLDIDVRVAVLEERRRLEAVGSTAQQPKPAKDEKQALDQLERLANEYMSVRISDNSARLQRKEDVADEMYRLVRANAIPKRTLAERGDEGFALALASCVIASPEPEDVDLLLTASENVARRHVRYKIVVALATLARAGLIAGRNVTRVRAVLDKFRGGADEPLLRQIVSLEALVGAT
jgi:hypothetical protein